jgi:hypothetical protein
VPAGGVLQVTLLEQQRPTRLDERRDLVSERPVRCAGGRVVGLPAVRRPLDALGSRGRHASKGSRRVASVRWGNGLEARLAAVSSPPVSGAARGRGDPQSCVAAIASVMVASGCASR